MKSIMEGNRKGTCWLCGREGPTEEHHIFGGNPGGKLSGRHGLTVHLCPCCHRDSREGVHADSRKMLLLHRSGQRAFERTRSRKEFMAMFGKNYLEDGPGENGQTETAHGAGAQAAGREKGNTQGQQAPGERSRIQPDGITWLGEETWTN